MLISTHTFPFEKIGSFVKIINLIKESGFDAFDLSLFNLNFKEVYSLLNDDDYLYKANELKKYIDKIGIVCNQCHAPFPVIYPNDSVKSEIVLKQIIRCLEIGSILNAKAVIVHPCNDFTPEQNKKFYDKLLPYCQKLNIKIALENMWNWEMGEPRACFASCSTAEDFLANIKLLDEKYFTCCLDIGHAEMMEDNSASKMILALNKHLGALHIHDNDCVHDFHALPFTMSIDFDSVIKSLKEVNYQGDITLEADSFGKKFPVELLPSVCKMHYAVANYIRKKILGIE